MGLRGGDLRDHILWTAKDLFLEVGYERASMDVVAERAATSKRSLYAHFESKDKLFLAVAELIRDLYLHRVKTPAAYGDDPAEAVALFCGRFLQMLLYDPALRACRLFITESGRLPGASSEYYDAIFNTPHERLAGYLGDHYRLTPQASGDIARQLLGQMIYPRLIRTLLGVEPTIAVRPDEASLEVDVDLAPVRRAVATLLGTDR
jgi:AcrR family transcriptional regulator